MEKQNTSDYCVYKHVLPDGRYYIGMTCNTISRWSYDGVNYKNTPLFYPCIEKYGWDNIEHIVLNSNLTLVEAQELERKYIKEAKNAGVSLNKNNGGTPGSRQKRSIEVRQKMSDSHRGLWYTKSRAMNLRKNSKWRIVPVKIYKEDKLIGEFDNLHHAERELGITRWSLMRSIRSGKPTRAGYLVIKI